MKEIRIGKIEARSNDAAAAGHELIGRPIVYDESTTIHAALNKAVEKSRIEARADSFSTSTNTAAVLPTATLNEIDYQQGMGHRWIDRCLP